MTVRSPRAADRLPSDTAGVALRKALGRIRNEVTAAVEWPRARRALDAMGAAFAAFTPRERTRERALGEIAIRAAQLRRHAKRDGRFCDAFMAAAAAAEARFRPARLQSYDDASVRLAAIRAYAEYVAGHRPGDGDAEALLTALAAHAPADRAILLAHADLLLDGGRAAEAEFLIRRALRINAVCQSGQHLLARATGENYDLSDKFCPIPFTHLSTSYKGDAFVCTCSAWLPYPVGNVIEAASAEEVWNSAAAREIRRSIHDGDFSYCSRTLCSYMAARSLPSKDEIEDPELRRYIDNRSVVVNESPDMVQMNHDPSCNLACPSCRTAVITAGPKEQRTYVDAAERVLLPLLRGMDGQAYITGGGEAFASTHYKKILRALNREEYPGLFVYLISNGQLLNASRWTEFPELPEMISVLSISIDAARAETYEKLRRPGKWHVLLENLEEISRMRASDTIRRFQINFVVQDANFREIPEFIALGIRLGVDDIWLQRLTNYGSFAEAAFEQADVTSPLHPNHEELLGILRPYVNDPLVNMVMLLPLLPEVVKAEATYPRLRARFRPGLAGFQPRSAPPA
jgi:wyosine [tRNA(Phe)-imidazoG37] synthetase (radical SAM superfamily)